VRRRTSLFAALLIAAAVLIHCEGVLSADAPCPDDGMPAELCAPEARSDFGMVATGSPEATHVAVDVLERGGNAIDAAVAAAFVLGVVDSDGSGIGGMTNLVIHLADGRTVAIDGTSYAPLSIDIERFRAFKKSGRTWGPETISVPTTLAALEYARARYGTMQPAILLQPAIDFAAHGYPLSKIQLMWAKKYHPTIMQASTYMRHIAFLDGRTIGSPGEVHCQPDLANTLRFIAAQGAGSFYRGRIAGLIDEDMVRIGAFLRRSDLARVRVREVKPLHTTYRGFDVYTFPPPGGGAGVIAGLNILENYPSEFLAEDSIERHQVLIEAFRIAEADTREASHRQSSFGTDPLGKRHARDRAAMIVPGKIIPEALLAATIPPECDQPGETTTQVSVADSEGNVVSLTQTLSRSFGAKVATPGLGFCYNSFLEFFNADRPQCPGYLQPNSPCNTDMSPTIVLRHGRLVAALGTPGSNRIQPIVVGVISNLVDRGMGIRDAVTAPRVLWGGVDEGRRVHIEVVDPISETDVTAFERIGYQNLTVLRYPPPGNWTIANFGGVNAVAYNPKTGFYAGVGDPRRYGSAMGPRVVAHE
jgi:gamma-glutamyltranspeptidase/glutathione hydrolase